MGWSTHHPVGLVYYAPQHCYRGYTLFATNRGGFHANLIDMQGRVCHRWYSEEGITYPYLLPNGNLLLRTPAPGTREDPKPSGGPPARFWSWTGIATWSGSSAIRPCTMILRGLPTGIPWSCYGSLCLRSWRPGCRAVTAPTASSRRCTATWSRKLPPPERWSTSGSPGNT